MEDKINVAAGMGRQCANDTTISQAAPGSSHVLQLNYRIVCCLAVRASSLEPLQRTRVADSRKQSSAKTLFASVAQIVNYQALQLALASLQKEQVDIHVAEWLTELRDKLHFGHELRYFFIVEPTAPIDACLNTLPIKETLGGGLYIRGGSRAKGRKQLAEIDGKQYLNPLRLNLDTNTSCQQGFDALIDTLVALT